MNNRLDNTLAGEPELVPSTGFLASVMERVKDEAAAPPPIPFPWKRAIPGMILAAAVLGWAGFELGRYVIYSAPLLSLRQLPVPVHIPAHAHIPAPVSQGLWTAVAGGVSIASWLLARRIAGRSGLI